MDDPLHAELQEWGVGNVDPKRMPDHFFQGAKFIDYSTAVRADASKQQWTGGPR